MRSAARVRDWRSRAAVPAGAASGCAPVKGPGEAAVEQVQDGAASAACQVLGQTPQELHQEGVLAGMLAQRQGRRAVQQPAEPHNAGNVSAGQA